MSVIDQLLSDVEADPASDSAVALGLVLETTQDPTSAIAERTLREAFPDVGAGRLTSAEISRITEQLLKLIREGKVSTGVLWALGRTQSPAASRELSTFLGQLLAQPSDATRDDLAYEALSSLMRLPSVAGTEELVSRLSASTSGPVKDLADRLLEQGWFSDTRPSAADAPDPVRETRSIIVDSTALVGAVSEGKGTILTFLLPESNVSADSNSVTLRVLNMPRSAARTLPIVGRRHTRWWRSRENPRAAVQLFVPVRPGLEHQTSYVILRYNLVSATEHGTYGDDVITELRLALISPEDDPSA
jgi:hypothetical protein